MLATAYNLCKKLKTRRRTSYGKISASKTYTQLELTKLLLIYRTEEVLDLSGE